MCPPWCCLVHPGFSLRVPTQAEVKSTSICKAHTIQLESVAFENHHLRSVALGSEARWCGRVEDSMGQLQPALRWFCGQTTRPDSIRSLGAVTKINLI